MPAKKSSPNELPEDVAALVDAYYAGELDQTQIDELRQRIAANPSVARAVARWESVHRQALRPPITDTPEHERLRDTLRRFSQEEAPPGTTPEEQSVDKPKGRRRRLGGRRLLLLVASLLLLAVVGFSLLRPTPEQQLVEEYFAWLPRQEATLGRREDAARGLAAYDRQEYGMAYPLLMQGVADGVLDSINLLYAAVAALGDSKPAPARDILNDFAADSERYPYEHNNVRYYLALAQLQLGEEARARELLREVADAGGEQSEPAADLISRLGAN